MIKINLVREGRAVRGAGAPAAATAVAGGPGIPKLNEILVGTFVALGLIIALGYWFWQKRELTQRQEIVESKQREADKLETIIKEVEEYQARSASLKSRIDLINQLKQNQKGPVKILDQISRDLPDLVWLDSMDISNGRVNLNGRGLNPNAIALFIENIKNDPYFEEPQVGSVTQTSAVQPIVYSFDMSFAFTYTPKNEAPAADAATSTAAPAATATAGTAAP